MNCPAGFRGGSIGCVIWHCWWVTLIIWRRSRPTSSRRSRKNWPRSCLNNRSVEQTVLTGKHEQTDPDAGASTQTCAEYLRIPAPHCARPGRVLVARATHFDGDSAGGAQGERHRV